MRITGEITASQLGNDSSEVLVTIMSRPVGTTLPITKHRKPCAAVISHETATFLKTLAELAEAGRYEEIVALTQQYFPPKG
jgi:hypothetical protein